MDECLCAAQEEPDLSSENLQMLQNTTCTISLQVIYSGTQSPAMMLVRWLLWL